MVRLEDARRIIAAERKAHEIGQPMNIAVADDGGNLVAHVRMNGAWRGSVDISIKKAWTSRAFDITTRDLADNAQPGKQFYGIHASRWQGDDLCRRHSPVARRKGSGCDRR
jgi:uncharacterized protein GlcG (DUF336 family)